MLSVIMLGVVVLNVVMLSLVVLIVVAPLKRLKRPTSDHHSSLVVTFVSYEEKSFIALVPGEQVRLRTDRSQCCFRTEIVEKLKILQID